MQVIVKRSEEKQRKVKRGREKTSRVKNRDMEEGKRGGEKGRIEIWRKAREVEKREEKKGKELYCAYIYLQIRDLDDSRRTIILLHITT